MIIANRHSQKGLSLVLAIFVIVVMSLLGAALMNILSSGTETVAREVVSARALMAAESGAQRQLNEIFPPGGVILPANCNSNTYTFIGLFGCGDVVIDCQHVTVNSVDYFTIKSTGSCGPSGDEAVRVIELQAKDS